MESNTNDKTIESFSKLTYRQRFAVTEYGYLLSPENAEAVGKMLGNFQEKDVLPFCQANGKKVSNMQEIETELKTSSIFRQEEQKETTQTPLPLFWDNRKKKTKSIFYIAVAVFILTLPYSLGSIFIIPILWFPAGLIDLVIGEDSKYAANLAFLLIFCWIFYFGIATVIVRSNKKQVVISMYILLILLLILNVAGCQIMGPSALDSIH